MPIFKFGMLLVRTMSKPVANAIKQRAVEKPRFRKMCHDFAQGWNRLEINLSLGLMGHSARSIKPLDEATAVKTGAEILGEAIVFAIAALALLAENRRAAASEARKNANIKAQFDMQQRRIQELEDAVSSLRTDTLELMKHGGKLSSEEMHRRMEEERRRRHLVFLHSRNPDDETIWNALSRWGQEVYKFAAGEPAEQNNEEKNSTAQVSTTLEESKPLSPAVSAADQNVLSPSKGNGAGVQSTSPDPVLGNKADQLKAGPILAGEGVKEETIPNGGASPTNGNLRRGPE